MSAKVLGGDLWSRAMHTPKKYHAQRFRRDAEEWMWHGGLPIVTLYALDRFYRVEVSFDAELEQSIALLFAAEVLEDGR